MSEKLHPDDGELVTQVINNEGYIVILRMGVVNGELRIEMIDVGFDGDDTDQVSEIDGAHAAELIRQFGRRL